MNQAGSNHALITGGAGFIGSHVTRRLLAAGWRVTVIDNFDPYHDPRLKRAALDDASRHPLFTLIEGDVAAADAWQPQTASLPGIDVVVHLASLTGEARVRRLPAQRLALELAAGRTVLEFAREQGVRLVVMASSAEVYGAAEPQPWSETDSVPRPLSAAAFSKRALELLAETYRTLYDLNVVMVRFSSLYGPWQREDTLLHRLTRQMLQAQPLAYDHREPPAFDLLYIDDAVDALLRLISLPQPPASCYNVGSGQPVAITELIACLRRLLAIKPERAHLPWPDDCPRYPWLDTQRARKDLGLTAATALETGVERFLAWFTAMMPFNVFGELSMKVKDPEQRFLEGALNDGG